MLGTRKPETSSMPLGASIGSSSASPYSIPSSSDASREQVHSIVDKHLTMRGDLESDGDILVRGKVIGNIKCKLLIIDAEAQVDGGIEAEEVVVRGRAKGKVKADRVRLERTAVVDCEIAHRSFAAEEGARIKGSLSFLGEEDGQSTIGLAA